MAYKYQPPSATIYKALLVAGMLGGAVMIGTMAASESASDTFSINDSNKAMDCHLITINAADNRDTLANALALASDTIRQTGCVNIEVQQ